ncbi:non-receptor serine/threonine protein kinase [Lithospermum erythrorhizon]|uniref:Non-receptor serine/threonine protein kinase n=1 Tax=Lithospermum erythrorhizon TaxID=34254 RepID=A0AAV3P251_LITER
MEQFRDIGKIVGSLRALMVLKHDIQINQRQCCLLLDMYELAFETISEEIRQNLRFDERNTKWKSLELPMEELLKIIKEGVQYIRYCLDIKDWWGKVMSLHMNNDCIEFHIHNLMCVFPVVIEAIETAAEISGFEEEVMLKRKFAHMKKYNIQCNNPKLFQWMFGKQYLMPRDIEIRLEKAWKEDRWLLLDMVKEKKNASSLAKHEQRLGDLLIKKLNGLESSKSSSKLLPSSTLVGASDYTAKRRLGTSGSHIKEVHWLGENFALRTYFGEIEPLLPEINTVLSLSHPNIMQYICGFYDGERKEGFLVMDLMSKSLDSYVKENCGQRKRVPFSLPVVLDVMLQIARGMEYLHSKGIYHGELNPSHILLKQRNNSPEGYYLAKVTGMVLNSIKKTYRNAPNSSNDGIDQVIWYAPEVLSEQNTEKHTEKADVYSFGMLCFLLLTGKTPFDDPHLQGEKVVRNITAGERPLFPYPSPRYLVNLTRKCWQTNPSARPSFSSICRILRYIKKTLIINPDLGQPDSPQPLVDYCDIEAGYYKKIVEEIAIQDFAPISQIPFQLFAYRLVEDEKTSGDPKDKTWFSDNGTFSINDNLLAMDDGLLFEQSDRRSVCSEIIGRRNTMYGADERSVTSEMPQRRRFFESDQRSIGSESPGRKNFSMKNVDQRRLSIATTTSESKSSTTKLAASETAINNKQRKDPTEAEQKEPVITVTPVAKSSLTTSEEENKKIVSIDEAKSASEIALKKSIAKKKSLRTLLSDIPEDISPLSASPKSKSADDTDGDSEITQKPVSLAKAAKAIKKVSVKPGSPEGRKKKAISEGKEKGIKAINTKQGSSPGRIFRRKSLAHSSTQVNKKAADSAKSTSLLRSTSSSPRHSSSYTTSKGYLSARQSPLHRCTRCTRTSEDNPLSTGSSARCKTHNSSIPWIS